MTATASDADGSVARVDFYNGGTLLGSDTTAPYSFTWSNVAAGTYALKATAVDNAGASGSSSVASVTVTGANQPPTVSITLAGQQRDVHRAREHHDYRQRRGSRESTHQSGVLPRDDAARHGHGRAVRVHVVVGAGGPYSLTARAYDAGGLNTTSAAVNVTVTAGCGRSADDRRVHSRPPTTPS